MNTKEMPLHNNGKVPHNNGKVLLRKLLNCVIHLCFVLPCLVACDEPGHRHGTALMAPGERESVGVMFATRGGRGRWSPLRGRRRPRRPGWQWPRAGAPWRPHAKGRRRESGGQPTPRGGGRRPLGPVQRAAIRCGLRPPLRNRRRRGLLGVAGQWCRSSPGAPMLRYWCGPTTPTEAPSATKPEIGVLTP